MLRCRAPLLPLLIWLCVTASCSPAEGPRGPIRHGMWVYALLTSTNGIGLLDQDAGGKQLAEFAQRMRLTEIYLSMTRDSMADPRFPGLVAGLRQAGLRVEALLRNADELSADIGAVLAYNRAHSEVQRLDGVHLDIEPWVANGDDYDWVPGLIETYRGVQRALANSGLSLAADVTAGKMDALNDLAGTSARELIQAATRLVVMDFAAPYSGVRQRAEELMALEGLPQESLMVATWVESFAIDDQGYAPGGACQNQAVLQKLDQHLGAEPAYAGWATFDYLGYLNSGFCPEGCCSPKP